MTKEEKGKVSFFILFGVPIISWFLAIKYTEILVRPKIKHLYYLATHTNTEDKPILFYALVGGVILGFVFTFLFNKLVDSDAFSGAPFKKFFRGSKLVTANKLAAMTRERKSKSKTKKKREQVQVSGVPLPEAAEQRHLLISGATGVGKSVAFKELAYHCLLRGDRIAVVDPNGDMLSKFYRPGDYILNPFDERTEGWTFFNEIRSDFDYDRYTLSMIPRGSTSDVEEWRSYARLLVAETARKLAMTSKSCSIEEVFRWTNTEDVENLQKFLAGTPAEALFVGADKALASARFVLSSILPANLVMPTGGYSIRRWIEDKSAGNLFITWREDMAYKIKPLISSWIDIICTTMLSLPENKADPLWLFLDELASLEKLPSLEAALTKGRKSGLRVVAGLQSTAQLNSIYGKEEAQSLRSCFRSLFVLGGSNTDPETCEEMSRCLGDHEVERDKKSHTHGSKNKSKNTSPERNKERIVLPSEISNLPDLQGYLAITGNLPVAKVELEPINFKNRTEAFIENQFRS